MPEPDSHRQCNLDAIEVKSPCRVKWDSMAGDEAVRFCKICTHNVYDLSTLTREEATKLVSEREGGLCVRFYRHADGRVLTADCTPVRFRRLRRRIAISAGFSLLLMAQGVVAFWSGLPRGDLLRDELEKLRTSALGRTAAVQSLINWIDMTLHPVTQGFYASPPSSATSNAAAALYLSMTAPKPSQPVANPPSSHQP